MAYWDERVGLPRGAVSAVPLLVLPMVLGSAALLVMPGALAGRVAVIVATIAVAWYLLGGAVSLAHILRDQRARRALSAIRGEVAAAPEPVWVCDAEGRILFQNNAARDMFDGNAVSVLDVLSRLRADAVSEMAQLSARAMRLGSAEIELGNGDALSLSGSPDAPLQIWAYHAAGAAPDQFEIAAALDQDDSAQDIETLPVAMLRVAADGRVRQANRAARRLLERDGFAPNGQALNLATLFEGPGRPLIQWLTEAGAGSLANPTEILRLRGQGRGGQDRHFQVALAPDPAERGGLVAVLTDISAMKTLEAQFVQSQKMQAIGQLAGGVAHDFNNLLTAIRGHCDLLMLRRDKGDPDYSDLDQISQNTNRAAALVGQLLAFSRKQTLRMETLDLRDTVADLTHLLNRLVGERITLGVSHDPALRPIRADKRQLEQVIMNLVVNARDAMPSGGEITIRTENALLDQALQRDRVSLPAGDYVRVTVSDRGCGIAPEHLAKIFEPFFTTKRTGEGTGLGLSTAYGIVKQTGGYIFCDSQPGVGTSFTIYLPALQHQAAPAPAARTETRSLIAPRLERQRQPRLLLVEDEAPVRAFAARALKLKGYEVIEADSAEAALTILADPALRVDLFLTDVVMPGMDGPSWVARARKTRPDAAVIFMSGYTEDIFAEGHEPTANSAFLPKPFTLTELIGAVEERLRVSPPALH
ncbi:hybrid sensor histidine kinase/response regulator [Paracoccus sp. (in: a-proteobacteria)]|uniref:hybrid sensor histidine kinase/response regulator n=1 Tax=Paracoccus sp. TaxID=267 RepID=UPI00272B8B60|nr:PAS domain-containing sensor histidine kinase [Paracoccus sp. (in: a-proteobacteria)]